jgi:predicted amidohydrolase YtcJ
LKKNIPQRQATHEFVDDASHAALMADLIGTTQASQLSPALDLYNEGVIVTLSSDWDAGCPFAHLQDSNRLY